MSNFIIAAPLQGWASALDEVPDAVFAERMMGDGLAIDPTDSALYAPFEGEIVSLPQTGHAVALRSDNGVEMLMHVGLETVALGGEGFVAHVCEGQRVRVGDRLLSFDLDLLAQRAKSLITPIILTNGERFDIVRRNQDRRVKVGDALLELRLRGTAAMEAGSGERVTRTATLAFEHGLHARPAATVAQTAQRFAAEISVSGKGRRANAKSPVSLMTLGAAQGDALTIEARGGDAVAAADAVAHALGAAPATVMPKQPTPKAKAAKANEIAGVTAAPGAVVGVAVRFVEAEITVTERGRGAELESAALARALSAVRAQIERAAAAGDPPQRAIMEAHAALLGDSEIDADARRHIADGKSAGFAWRAAVRRQAEALAALKDAYMTERVADLRDIERQVLTALGVTKPVEAPPLPQNAIILADEILPSQFAALDRERVVGLCMARGGATSHVALLAAAAGVPAIAAAGPRVLEIADGTELLLDADAGVLRLKPSRTQIDAVRAADGVRAAERSAASQECRMADGAVISIFANLASAREAEIALTLGAEGCGLLRTEFLFMDRATPPSMEEQRAAYQAVSDALGGRPLVIRTLDAAPDKPVAYLPAPHEDNPALGLRGLRASLRQPELLRAQLEAIARVTPEGAVRVLLPMVTDVSELSAVRAILKEIGRPLALGAMIETPSAALLTDQIAEEADFLSIGTNDLSQYALAMDRGHPDLAGAIDALHPAVLRLVKATVEGARKQSKPVSVCGAAASDLLAAPILVGLGVDTLSLASAMIPAVKAKLRTLKLADCQAAAERALACESAAAVRALSAKIGEGA